MSERKLLRKPEAAKLLGSMALSTLEKLTSNRRIPHVKIGAAVYYDTDDLWAWIEQQKIPAIAGAPGQTEVHSEPANGG
jgi:excisionase family DNA binding protein